MQMLQPTERSAFLVLFGPHETIDEAKSPARGDD
jgi:hypothetical protein